MVFVFNIIHGYGLSNEMPHQLQPNVKMYYPLIRIAAKAFYTLNIINRQFDL